MRELVVALDVGGTKTAGAVVDADGRLYARQRTATPRTDGEALTARVVALAGELADRCADRPAGVGVSVAGAVDAAHRQVLFAPNLPGWDGFPLGDLLAESLGMSAHVVYDGHAGAVGEHWRGAGRGARDLAFLIVGTGVGGGLVLDGVLRRGAHGVAGAAGWMIADPVDARRPAARRHGTLESVAAGPALVAAAHRAGLARIETPHDLVRAAGDGDETARGIVSQAAERVAHAVTGIVSVLDLDVAVLGGGLGAGVPAYVDAAREAVAALGQPLARDRARVVPAELGDDAFLLGAARLALNPRVPSG